MKNTLLAVFVSLSLAGAARAEHDGASKEHVDGRAAACKADAEKFCKDVKPGGGRVMACLKAHEDQLSDSCKAKGAEKKAEFKEKHPKMAAAMEACKADKEKFCKDVEPGEGRIVDCMKSHATDLSSSCRETIERKHHENGGDHKEKSKE